MRNFKDQVVIITGASEGIGAELADLFAAQGANIMLAARRQDMLEELAKTLRERYQAKCQVHITDVCQEADCAALIAATLAHFGKIDVLINNAGISAHAYFEQVSDFSIYEKVLNVNYLGAMRCTRFALPYIKKSKGIIIAVSSYAGKTGVPGRTAYSASKFALAGFMESLRIELRDSGIKVCVAFPGVILTNTRINGFGADGKPLGESRLREEGGMSARDCAKIIFTGIANDKREVYTRFIERIGLWIKLIAPSRMENMALNALKQKGR